MHICFITGIFPPDIGGPATYVSRLAEALHQQGYNVCVLAQGDKEVTYPFPVRKVSRAYPLPLRLLFLFCLFIRYGWRSEVWYINGLELPAVLAGKLLRKRLVMKIVGDYAWERAMNAGLTHDSIDDFQQKKQYWKVEFHKYLRAWLARQVAGVITPSQYLKTLVRSWGMPEERVHVIYNAVEELPENPGTKLENREKFGLKTDDYFIITVGRLVVWKGVERLIHVIAQLDEQVHLLIAGGGPQRHALMDLAERLEVANRVKFLGKVDRNRLFSYMKAADMLVLNTAYEGFSHALLEAMMVGIPVITTPVCGNPELVTHGQNGILVEQNDCDALANQILKVLHDTSLQTKLIEGGKAALQHYSWDRLLKHTIQVLCDSRSQK